MRGGSVVCGAAGCHGTESGNLIMKHPLPCIVR